MMDKTLKNFDMGRRRTLKIIAAAGGSLASTRIGLASGEVHPALIWRGTALGARASLTLYHVGKDEGRRLVKEISGELQRLESMFSLYRADSAVSLLNAGEYVGSPPIDLVRLLSEARVISEVTEGAFDVTVQPLWNTYADYYRNGGSGSAGPELEAIDRALELVDYRGVDISSQMIRLKKPGMSVTLNGIAQGYITDRVADLLRSEGMRNVLIDLGEIRALDTHPAGRPWAVGLQDPARPGQVAEVVDIDNQAVATSAGAGTRFGGNGANHHIFNPDSGRSSNIYSSISVVGKFATVADALSTGLYNLQPQRARTVLAGFPGYSAHVLYAGGLKQNWTG
jgi:thiamine biosynthesis lipoprotein